MKVDAANIIPITKARSKLGDLAEKVADDSYIVLTKDGSPKAALVDISYLTKLENEVNRLYKKTFIDPKLLPYSREFTNQEIQEWKRQDSL